MAQLQPSSASVAAVFDKQAGTVGLPIQNTYDFKQIVHGIDCIRIVVPAESCRIQGQNASLHSPGLHQARNGQGTRYSPHRAVQPQFSHYDIVLQLTCVYLSRGGQYAYGEGQVKAAALLAQVGRGQVDGQVGHGKLEAIVLHRRGYAVLALLDG